MGGAAVSDSGRPAPARARWQLDASLAPEVQKLVVSGFARLSAARALLLHAERGGGGWIGAMQAIVPVTAADAPDAGGAPAMALAFTSLGLAQVGLGRALIDQFPLPFVEGMMQADRRKRLGDVGAALASPLAWGPRPDAIEAGKTTAQAGPAIHALALVYDVDHAALDARVASLRAALAAAGVTIVRDKVLDLKGDDVARSREHFGFVDGVSQPIPYGAGTCDRGGAETKPDPLHGVPLGEILLGHADAHASTTRGPFITGTWEKDVFTPTPAAATSVATFLDPATQAPHDLARNGTYLVVRELDQDVKGFWDSMETAARRLNQSADWLAERVVGRTRDGHMLRPNGPLPPGKEGPDNDFLYFLEDGQGHGCPMGAHVRRANPRDGLSPKPSFCENLLRSANAHRLLRRGRKYGGGIGGVGAVGETGPKGDEGLLFIGLNADIARQFEFVQQNWMLNPNFVTLFGEVDPLVGPAGPMTLPARPLRRRASIDTFVKLVGGDYFFLPSLPTVRLLAGLRPPTSPPVS